MKKILITACLLSLVTFTGCVPISTKLAFNPSTGELKWNNPKDTTFHNLEISQQPDGSKLLKIGDWSTLNNPAVIQNAGQADAAIIKQVGETAVNLVGAGASLATTMGTQAATVNLSKGVQSALARPSAPSVHAVAITNTPLVAPQ